MYEKYLNRIYFYGKNDCASLSVEFLRNELNLDIKDFPRKSLFQFPNYCHDCCIENDFIDIDDIDDIDNMDLQFGDVIICKLKNNLPIHLLVYIKDNLVLTIAPFKMSNLYPLEEEIKINPVVYHMRHKSQFK